MKKIVLIFLLYLLCSCEMQEKLSMKGTDYYLVTTEYLPMLNGEEPPFLLCNGGVFLNRLQHISWNDTTIIATVFYCPIITKYSDRSDSMDMRYYIVQAKDSILTGKSLTDTRIGPLDSRQYDSVVVVYNINTKNMKAINFRE